jgi:hypothetical protein
LLHLTFGGRAFTGWSPDRVGSRQGLVIRLIPFGTVALMAEVVETHDLTAPSQDGWAIWFDPADDGNLRHQVSSERAPAYSLRAN